jgi:endonuclease III-like uncharacterized protein
LPLFVTKTLLLLGDLRGRAELAGFFLVAIVKSNSFVVSYYSKLLISKYTVIFEKNRT